MGRSSGWSIPLTLAVCVSVAPAPVVASPVYSASPSSTQAPKNHTDRLLLGTVEFVSIQPGSLHLMARIDSGAKTSSLHAENVTMFKRDGRTWLRFATVTGRDAEQRLLELPCERWAKIQGENGLYESRPVVLRICGSAAVVCVSRRRSPIGGMMNTPC